jgi:DNA polymerase type B, organellar and viral
MRRAHWLKGNPVTRIPRHHICIATTVRPFLRDSDDRVLDRVCIRVGHWDSGRWVEAGCSIHSNTASFTESMMTLLDAMRSAWVWMLRPAQDMPALRFTQRVAEGQIVRKWWVWGDPPVIVSGKWFGKPVTILGVPNWVDVRRACDELELPPARCSTYAVNAVSPFDSPSYWEGARCSALVGRILKFVNEEDLGHLRPTAGGQAMQSYRHLHLGEQKILVDNHRSALALERSCAIGFPVCCTARGRISDPTYVVDVNSLYPWVMHAYSYPRKRTYFGTCASVDALRQSMQQYVCIAQVWGRDPQRTYLVQAGHRCVYTDLLQGETICGPDLDSFVTRGCCYRVGLVACYDAAPLFNAWGQWAWDMRMRYRARGDALGEMLAKSLSVSLWGKFAGTLGQWGPLPPGTKPPGDYGRWPLLVASGEVRECRSIAGIHEMLAEDVEPDISCPAISAFVAAYARTYMEGLRAIAGAEEVRYQCADALHVTHLGYMRLHGHRLIRPGDFGALKCAGPFTDACYVAPNVYRIGGRWVYAGRPVDARETAEGGCEWESPARLSQSVYSPMTGRVRMYHHGQEGTAERDVHVEANAREKVSAAKSGLAKPPSGTRKGNDQ